MSKLKATYSVVLRHDIPPREAELLDYLCCKITNETHGDLLHFMCTEIDTSHHFYIHMETFKPNEEVTHTVSIPHHYVFLISGSKDNPAIGFLPYIESI